MPGPSAPFFPSQQTFKLADAYQLSTRHIMLADLLPANAPDELRGDAESIVLGLTPQAGTCIILEGSALRAAFPARWHGFLQVPARIKLQRAGKWLFHPDIVQLVSSQLSLRLSLDALHLQHPVFLPVGKSIKLQLISEPGHTMHFLILCGGSIIGKGWFVHPESGALSSTPRVSELPPMVVRKSMTAILHVTAEVVQKKIEVECLENGRVGQYVRVYDNVSDNVYLARIEEDGTLRCQAVTGLRSSASEID